MTAPERASVGQYDVDVAVVVNGVDHQRRVEVRQLLVDFIRDEIGLTGTHIGCDSTNCGACTVLVDGRSVKSCTMFAAQADGCRISTVEGLAGQEGLSTLQRAFQERHALQCGFCTPGMLMSAVYLLSHHPKPDEAQVRRAIAGNLCRCTGYTFIVEAILAAANVRAELDPDNHPATSAPSEVSS